MALLMLYGVLVYVRVPRLFWEPRFWAEEGALHFATAYVEPFWEALFAVHQGYLRLVNNAVGIAAAHAVPLEYAPDVTLWLAFALQLLPAVLLLLNDYEAFSSVPAKAAALALILFAVPSQEVWLNTTNAQVFLGLSAALVLLARSRRGMMRYVNLGVVVVAGVSGIQPLLLVPFFWWRAWRERTVDGVVQTVVLTACGVAQGAVVAFSLESGARYVRADALIFLHAVFVKLFVLPFAGMGPAHELSDALVPALRAGEGSWAMPTATVGLLVLLCVAVRASRAPHAGLLMVMSLFVAYAGFAGSLNAVSWDSHIMEVHALNNTRYYYLPSVFLRLGLLSAVLGAACTRWVRVALSVVLLWIAVMGVHDYFRSYPNYAWYFTGPKWRQEIRLWKQEPGRVIDIWPGPWKMYLPPPGTKS